MNDDHDELVEQSEQKAGGLGTLYFMREVDYLTAETFDYFKIGIVRGAKDVAAREKQHNTGNPRNVVTHLELSCAEVQALETRLHNRFARHRVSSNEWFFLPDGVLDVVIAAARTLRDEIDAAAALAVQVASLQALPRTGAVLESTPEIESTAKTHFLKKSELKVLQKNTKAITDRLRQLFAADPALEKIMKRSVKSESRNFSAELLRKAHKDLYEQFCVPVERIDCKITFASAEADAEALALRGKLEIAAESLEALDGYALHQEYLRLWGEKDRLEAEIGLLENQLLIACGDASGIDGVLQWQVSTSNRFDKAKFKESYPNIYEECHKTTEARTTYAVAEWASYRL